MAHLYQLCFIQAFALVCVCSASSQKPFLHAHARRLPAIPHVLVAVPAPAPAVAAAPGPAIAAAPAAAAVPAVPAFDCTPTCEQAKKMWKDAEEAQALSIELDKNRTAARIQAEADLLVENVKLKVHELALADSRLLEANVKVYLEGRIQAFSSAVSSRHAQVMTKKAQNFQLLKAHQSQLMENLMAEIRTHAFDVAKVTTAREAQAAGANFNANPQIQGALQEVTKAGDQWVQTYLTTQDAAKQGFTAWSTAYHNLDGPWSNVTGSFEKANSAEQAASGLGPDTRWAHEIVRVSGDVTQAARTEDKRSSSEVNLAANMAKKVAAVVAGNSDSIVKLEDMLATAEDQANQASLAR